MKTTVDLPDDLLRRARERARAEKTTLRSLLAEGLRNVLAARQPPAAGFKLRRASFKGKGLQPQIEEGSWDRLRDLAYEGRGA